MSHTPGVAKFIEGNKDVILKPGDTAETSLAKTYYKDLCLVGKEWVDALKYTLPKIARNVKLRFSPTVHSKKDDIPGKPPPMRYTDLPIYDSPHYEYKTYIEESKKLPNSDEKILHSHLYPSVHKYRLLLEKSISEIKNDLGDMKEEGYEAICNKGRCCIQFMRDPDNLVMRRAVLGASTASGVYIGSGTRGIVRKLFASILASLGAGALCFPKETDLIFKDTCYIVTRLALLLYNTACGNKILCKKRVSCPENLQPPENK